MGERRRPWLSVVTSMLLGLAVTAGAAELSAGFGAVAGAQSAAELVLGSPSSVGFGPQPVGKTASMSVVLRNGGGGNVGIASVGFPAGSQFGVIDAAPCLTTLAPGASCPLTLTFTPTATGLQSDGLEVVAPVGGFFDIFRVTGVGEVQTRLEPSSVDFARVAIGEQTPASTVTLSNLNGIAITDLQVATASPFEIVSDTCTGTLPPESSCAVEVVFIPQTIDRETQPLTFSGTTPFGALAEAATLNGPGAAAELIVTAADLGTVAVGRQASRSVTVTNVGTDALILTVGDPTHPAFRLDSSTCEGVSLAPAASCELTVTFSPDAPGPVQGVVNVIGEVQTAETTSRALLSGTGAATALEMAPAPV